MSLSLKNDYAKGRTNSMFWSENIHNFVLLFNLKTFFFIIAVGVVKKRTKPGSGLLKVFRIKLNFLPLLRGSYTSGDRVR